MASMTEEPNVYSHVILINLNLNSHQGQMATLLGGTSLEE